MVFSELGSLDFEPSSKLVLFVIYNHQSRWCQLTVTRSPVPLQAQAFDHACQDKLRSVGKHCSSVAHLMPWAVQPALCFT